MLPGKNSGDQTHPASERKGAGLGCRPKQTDGPEEEPGGTGRRRGGSRLTSWPVSRDGTFSCVSLPCLLMRTPASRLRPGAASASTTASETSPIRKDPNPTEGRVHRCLWSRINSTYLFEGHNSTPYRRQCHGLRQMTPDRPRPRALHKESKDLEDLRSFQRI